MKNIKRGVLKSIYGAWIGGAFTIFSGFGFAEWQWWVFAIVTVGLVNLRDFAD